VLLGPPDGKYGVPLYLHHPFAEDKTRHAKSYIPGRQFPEEVQKHITSHPTTLWHLMQASADLRKFVRPLYMAHTFHFICVDQLSAYQHSVFCEPESIPRCRSVSVYLDTMSVPIVPLVTFNHDHRKLNLAYCDYRAEDKDGQLRYKENLSRLIELRNEDWMVSLLKHVKDLTIDRRGDIRLSPDPKYFAKQPDVNDLRRDLAELRLHTSAALYMLLLPKRASNKSRKMKDWWPNNKRPVEELGSRYWRKGARLGRIQKVNYRVGIHADSGLDVVPSTEFVARGCSLWEVGIARGWLETELEEPVWLRMFPAVGQDVEDDGFEVRESGGEDDLDWQPHPIEQEDGSSSGDDEQDDSDISDLLDLSDAGV
jgi:hypothetical protein